MLEEFKKFAMRGNVIDMAVGIIIGASFGGIVNSLVNDVLMPPLGFVIGKVDLSNLFVILREGAKAAAPYASVADAKAAGAVTLNYGLFINAIISFVIVAFAVFMLVRTMNRMQAKKEDKPATPPEPPHQEKLLAEIRDTEIRDILKQKNG